MGLRRSTGFWGPLSISGVLFDENSCYGTVMAWGMALIRRGSREM